MSTEIYSQFFINFRILKKIALYRKTPLLHLLLLFVFTLSILHSLCILFVYSLHSVCIYYVYFVQCYSIHYNNLQERKFNASRMNYFVQIHVKMLNFDDFPYYFFIYFVYTFNTLLFITCIYFVYFVFIFLQYFVYFVLHFANTQSIMYITYKQSLEH